MCLFGWKDHLFSLMACCCCTFFKMWTFLEKVPSVIPEFTSCVALLSFSFGADARCCQLLSCNPRDPWRLWLVERKPNQPKGMRHSEERTIWKNILHLYGFLFFLGFSRETGLAGESFATPPPPLPPPPPPLPIICIQIAAFRREALCDWPTDTHISTSPVSGTKTSSF